MPLKELPIGLALIPCDTILEDVRTRKKSLIGLFSQVAAVNFPYVHPTMNILVTLTGCYGKVTCYLECVHAETGSKVLSIPCSINAESPMDVVDVAVTIQSLRFPVPGRYTFQVLVDGVPLMLRPINVLEKTYGKKTDTQEPPDESIV